ncbi:MAG: MgtC/SapB family protein [Bacilli bacterium]|nr:MgtC/SapB family protein [Bacilli bacterium]
MSLEIFIIRIFVCFILCIVIGLERQYRHGPVGLRTNVLVGLGSFLFNYATYSFVEHDQSRIAASIVSGIGFLGAGMIIKDGKSIKGLNTAATLWCVAAIGLLTSVGMIWESIIGTSFVLLSNIILRFISFFIMDRVKKSIQEKCIVRITCQRDVEIVVRSSFSKYIEKNELKLGSLEKKIGPKNSIRLTAIIETSRVEMISKLVQNLSAEPGVVNISWKHYKKYKSEQEDYTED